MAKNAKRPTVRRLGVWRRRIDAAFRRGHFTQADRSACRNPLKCALGEVAKWARIDYAEAAERLDPTMLQEEPFMKAVEANDFAGALRAVVALERAAARRLTPSKRRATASDRPSAIPSRRERPHAG